MLGNSPFFGDKFVHFAVQSFQHILHTCLTFYSIFLLKAILNY